MVVVVFDFFSSFRDLSICFQFHYTFYPLLFTIRTGCRHSFHTCEVYDAGVDGWSFIRRMAKPRRNFAAAACDGQLFVFGGFDGVQGIFFDSEVYDERSGQWRHGPDVPGCLWNYAVAA